MHVSRVNGVVLSILHVSNLIFSAGDGKWGNEEKAIQRVCVGGCVKLGHTDTPRYRLCAAPPEFLCPPCRSVGEELRRPGDGGRGEGHKLPRPAQREWRGKVLGVEGGDQASRFTGRG